MSADKRFQNGYSDVRTRDGSNNHGMCMSGRTITSGTTNVGEAIECKIVLLGDSFCGKSALIQRFVGDCFLEIYSPTSFDKYVSSYSVSEFRINFILWDTSGSCSYDTIRPLAYQDAKVFLLCFKIGDPSSLVNIVSKWSPEIKQHSPGNSVPVILCGCQSDLRNDIETISILAAQQKIPVTSEQALAVSREIGATTYVETSARISGRGVKDAFEVAALAAMGRLNKNHSVLHWNNKYSSNNNIKNLTKLDLRSKIKTRARSCQLM